MTTQILIHHGIKGQKWGVKNGPPYPLGEGNKSRAEKRASSGRHASKKESSPSKKFWTDERKATAKKIAKGTAITAAVVLAAYGGYKLSQTNVSYDVEGLFSDRFGFDSFKTGARAANHTHEGISGSDEHALDKLSSAVGIRRDNSFVCNKNNILTTLKDVFPYTTSEERRNCGSTATSALLNMLGFKSQSIRSKDIPVSVRGDERGTNMEKLLSKGFGISADKIQSLLDSDIGRKGSSKAVSSKLADSGEGAFGYIWFAVPSRDKKTGQLTRSGHVAAWRVVNGKPLIVEGQDEHGGRVLQSLIELHARFYPDSVQWACIGHGQSFDSDVVINPSIIGGMVKGV